MSALSTLGLSASQAVLTAAEAGFPLVGLRLIRSGSETLNSLIPVDRDLQQALRDTDIDVLDVEFLRITNDIDEELAVRLFDAAGELGAQHIVTIVEDADLDRAADSVGRLGELSSPFGVSLAVEPVSFTSLRTPDQAVELVRASGANNVEVILDPLHLSRAGVDLRRLAAIPAHLIGFAQLCDAPSDGKAADMVEARREALTDRLPPGLGVLPLWDLVAAIPRRIPLSVEVPCPPGTEVSNHARGLFARSLEFSEGIASPVETST